MRHQIGAYLFLLMSGSAYARSLIFPPEVEWLTELNDQESFSAALLTGTEQQQIVEQIENSSFDTPDSWLSELRVRRVPLGDSEGLVIRATHMLCGATVIAKPGYSDAHTIDG